MLPLLHNASGSCVVMPANEVPMNSSDKSTTGGDPLNDQCGGQTLAFLVLRGWLGMRALLAGIEKFSGFTVTQQPLKDPTTGMDDPSGAMIEVKQKFYSLTNYSAIPSSLKDKFAHEPLLPKVVSTPFYASLGWILILLGAMLLLGLCTRVSLALQGLVYIALTVGLILINQNDGVAFLGIHVGLIALALV